MGKRPDTIARLRARYAALLIGAAPAALVAQTTNSASPAPPPAPAPTTVTAPDLQHFSLPPGQTVQPAPAPTLVPVIPSPAQTPVLALPPVRSTNVPRAATPAAPTPRAASRASAPPKAQATSAPATQPAPVSQPTAVPSPTPAPVPVQANPQPAPATPLAAPAAASSALWWILGTLGLVALLALGWLFTRRRGAAAEPALAGPAPPPLEPAPPPVTEREVRPAAAPPPAPVPPPVQPAPAMFRPSAPAERTAEVAIALDVRRAGLNLTSAAVEYAVELRNLTDQPLTDVRVDIRMLTASERQAATVAAIFAGPIDSPALAPFALSPGAPVSFTGRGLLPRESLSVLTMEERRFFVPVLAIRILYTRANGSIGEATSVQAVGVDRGGGQKLAPFRLDGPPRMFDTVAARPV